MNKKDLKPGYVVEVRYLNLMYLCMQYADGLVFNALNGDYIPLINYDENLMNKNASELDIIRVYGFCQTPYNAIENSINNRPLLWERKEEPTEEDVLKTAIATYGNEAQLCVAMEECAELIQAISKYKRYGSKAQEQLAEEIADVLIVVEEVKLICGIKDEQLKFYHDKKIARLKERLENAKEREENEKNTDII